LILWYQVLQKLGRALKFGQSRVAFTQFPYRLGESALLRWQPDRGVHQVRKGTFTLRCVAEWKCGRSAGQDEIWCGTWLLDQPRTFQLKDEVELRYELPAVGRPTQLSADEPVFWELEVKLDLPGLDFKETYLVPIYSSKITPRLEASRN
jgi:hypothetical protein